MRNYPALPKDQQNSQFAKQLQTLLEASIKQHRDGLQSCRELDYTRGRYEGREQLLRELLYDILGVEYSIEDQ